jgi:hypothetical protein
VVTIFSGKEPLRTYQKRLSSRGRGFKVQGVMRGAMRDGEQYFHEDLMMLRLAR